MTRSFNTSMIVSGMILAAIVTLASVTSPVSAAPIVVQPDSATASSTYWTSRDPAYAINGDGLSNPDLVNTDDPVPAAWPSHGTNKGDNWLDDGEGGDPDITFDLGEDYQLSKAHVWNNNSDASRSVKDVDILYSTDGENFTKLDSFTFPEAPESATYEGDDVDFGSYITARYVKFDVQNNHGGDNYTGLSEVRFVAIPEPASAALLLLGLTGLLTRRPRRRA